MVITNLDDITKLTNRLQEETAYVYPVAVDALDACVVAVDADVAAAVA